MEVDRWFIANTKIALTSKEFCEVAEAIQEAGSVEKQNKLADLFKTLNRDEVINRASRIVQLSRLLKTIRLNRRYDISSTQTT